MVLPGIQPNFRFELHSPEVEADLCHQTIYHQDYTRHCSHQSHLNSESKGDYHHLSLLEAIICPEPSQRILSAILTPYNWQARNYSMVNVSGNFSRGPPSSR